MYIIYDVVSGHLRRFFKTRSHKAGSLADTLTAQAGLLSRHEADHGNSPMPKTFEAKHFLLSGGVHKL